ncbi:MAG: sel1 repeat family protein [Alphaproteobacteria bacterium]|nr:sel1 repeat family protein [Alphaproteobacteria bacterium]MBO4644101.1 sel1 repeat family protein [Alphaproteobacteria bacterium]
MKKLIAFVLFLSLTSCSLIEDYHRKETPFTEFEKGIAAFSSADYPKAMKYLTGPAESGNADAQYIIGMIYLYGLTDVKNLYMAQKWLTMAAEEGQQAAQEQLAFLYRNEYTPLYNPITAYHWFSVIIEDNPQHQENMENLEWALRSRGLLRTAQTLPQPKEKRYKGVNFNSLFPLR